MKEVRAVSDHTAAWGEGPVWWEPHLWWVDIKGHRLLRLQPDTGAFQEWNMGQRIGFALPRSDGSWIWGGDGGLYTLDPESGESRLLVDPEPDRPCNRFNDAAVSPDGRLFAGTIAMDKTEGAATLYRLDPGPVCTPVIPGVTNSNGIGWSPDGGTLFYIDTPTRKIMRYDYQEGSLSGGAVLADTDPVVDASPDGLCVDAEGHVWVAFCHGGCVVRFDHQDGRELERFEVPAKETTSCCFGGSDLRDLYITTGVGTGEKASDGRVYRVSGIAVPGQRQTAALCL